jgi:hypothetical protein
MIPVLANPVKNINIVVEDNISNLYRKDGYTTGVPEGLFPYVKNFCEKISTELPIFIPVKPESNSKISECFNNVDEVIKNKGGRRILGWRIWEWYGIMIEAELHAVWLSMDEEMIDITPLPFCFNKTLFLPNSDIVYKDEQIDNIRQPLIDSQNINEFIKMHKDRFNLLNKGERSKQFEVKLTGEELSYFNKLNGRINELFILIHKSTPGRNDLCRCGSGSKYKKCCGK